MAAKYSIEDLTQKDDSAKETKRLFAIFNDLVKIGSAGKSLSYHEQEFVMRRVMYIGNDLDHYPYIADARLWDIYLTYHEDLSGGKVYKKWNRTTWRTVGQLEKEADLQFLTEIEAERWGKIIAKTNHTEQLLQIVGAEFREEIRSLNKDQNTVGNPLLKGSYFYQYKIWNINLRAAFVYLKAKKVAEINGQSTWHMTLCGEDIEFNDFALVHILNRHFAEITKQVDLGKSYHNENVDPEKLGPLLKNIIEAIDHTGLLTAQYQTCVNLRYKGDTYQFWAEWKERHSKGKVIPYKRVQTFYQVNDPILLSDIQNNNKEVVINAELSVFVP